MAEVVVSVAAKLAEYLVDPTVRQLQHLFCVCKITRNVEITKKELRLKRGRVQERVQEAINRTERIDDEVNKWQDDVESLIAEVEKLEQELTANHGCLRGWCPTWRRYRLCKQLAKTTQRMIDLKNKSDFNPFSHHFIAPDIQNHSQNFKYFNSTQIAYNQLWEALQDDGISIIGLWGMGGSGKTALVTEVKKKAQDSGLFDRVLLTTISQNPHIRDIQGEIADALGLKLEEESNKGRANRIALRLQSGERILIVVDDAWAKLNLEDIGIPFGGNNHQRSCKVLLTTRKRDVCTLMECQNIIQLYLLQDEEAWTLFQTHANVGDATKDVARAIAKECKGLPIAIVAMGSCLKEKGIDEMNEMLYRLRNAKPIINVDKGVRDAFTCLELSYDYLEIQEAKLLLMCAIFPEDHKIVIEDLFRYGVGLGLCRDVDSFEIARSTVRRIINRLIDSSLLMHSPNFNEDYEQGYVTMHDVVRDFTLWKASKEDSTIMVDCTKELNELIDDERVKDCYAVSSWYDNNKLLQFPSQLDAPKLEFLLLCSSVPLDISHASFEGTKKLKALIIMCTSWQSIIELQPQSVQHLSNLRTLRLQRWDLHDISFVVSLTGLEILDLQGSEFQRVPNGIQKLNKLKLLDLSGCIIEECCYEVIGSCSRLEELYVTKHCPHFKKQNCYEYLVGATALVKLKRYNLEIGDCVGWTFQNEGTRSLHLGQLNISKLDVIIKDLAQRATAIGFHKLVEGGICFMTNIVQAIGGMNEVSNLCLTRCSKIECIMDETTLQRDAIVPRLVDLVLRDMDNLKQLCRGHSPFTLFQKMERLRIFSCPQLLHIFPADCNLGYLKLLQISGCPMLTSLFLVSTACTLFSLEELRIRHCSELKHVLEGEGCGEAWENLRFPKLKILSVADCDKLEYVCPTFLAQRFEQLQRLSVRKAAQMKFVFGENAGEDKTQLVLPLLKYLKLWNLPNLVRICSEGYLTSCPSIKIIQCSGCPNMELQEIMGGELRNGELYKPFTAIEKIQLDNCGVESIFHCPIGVEAQIPTFQYLRELTLEKCPRLKSVFSAQICQSLPDLTSLTINDCAELVAIFSGNEGEDQKNLSIPESCLVKLNRLEIFLCNKLKFVLSFMISATPSMLPQLGTLKISDCAQMEEIFKCSNTEDHDIDIERDIRFPKMKSMALVSLPRLVHVCQGFKFNTSEFCSVRVDDCPKLVSIKSAAINWTREKKLVREYELTYSHLNNREVLNLPFSMLNVGEPDIQSARVEHDWQVIGDDEPEEQQMPGGVVPTQVMRFQYLHSLSVTNIKGLKFLFSVSTIVQNSLPTLNSLTLADCEELEVIIGRSSEDGANYGDTIVLPTLRNIKLQNLPNFKSVCQVGLQIQAELRQITIGNCPKFVDTSLGSALQQLGTISVSREDSNVEKGMSLISRAEILHLYDSMNLPSGWEGPTFIKFQNLKILAVSKCGRLKCIFPSTVIRSLPCLERLRIIGCEELEEIMSSEEEIALPNNSLCFPQLAQLEVERCGKLKWLFPSLPSTQLFPRLYCLEITECPQTKGLFNSQAEIHEEGCYNAILPQLRSLLVEDCPIFSETTLAFLEELSRWNRERQRQWRLW